MVCWRCKQDMPDGLRYCGNCGVRMNRSLYYLEWIFSKRGLPVLVVLLLAIAAAVFFRVRTELGTTASGPSPLEIAIQERIDSEKIVDEEIPPMYTYSNAVLDAVTFQVKKDDREEGIAKVSFTYVDVLALAEEMGDEITDQDAYYQACLEKIASDAAPTKTQTIELHYTVSAEGGKTQYTFEESLEFSDVLTGGTASAYLELIQKEE